MQHHVSLWQLAFQLGHIFQLPLIKMGCFLSIFRAKTSPIIKKQDLARDVLIVRQSYKVIVTVKTWRFRVRLKNFKPGEVAEFESPWRGAGQACCIPLIPQPPQAISGSTLAPDWPAPSFLTGLLFKGPLAPLPPATMALGQLPVERNDSDVLFRFDSMHDVTGNFEEPPQMGGDALTDSNPSMLSPSQAPITLPPLYARLYGEYSRKPGVSRQFANLLGSCGIRS